MPNDYEGKTIGELIDGSTKILTEFREGYDYKAIKLKHVDYVNGPDGKLVVLDCSSGFVLIVNGENVEAMFNVYEIRDFDINKKRGLLTVSGHETTSQYWFDDGEYEVNFFG